MSFILDALRKSENERQRNASPGIADTPVRQRSEKRSIWLPLVAVLLGINLSLVGVLWYTSQQDDSPAPQSTAAPPAPAVARPVPPRPAADPAVSRELSAELETPAEPAMPAPAAAPVAVQQPLTPAPRSAAQTPADMVVDVPTFAELSLDGSLSLPALSLELHVYSDQAAERFVYINSTKYREREEISEGPVIEAINPLGVILTYQGRRFLLTRE
jgi:general secretion pathway protein B